MLERKGILVILDGLGDRPIPSLDDRTPLEAAHTPHMDRLVTEGLCGLVDPLHPGVPVDTQTGTGVLLGLPPQDVALVARGPVEASGVGMELQPGDVAMRCNFATLETHEDGLLVLDRRAGRIRERTQQLADAINALPPHDGIEALLLPSAQHRAVLRLRGPGLSADVSDTDPGAGMMPRPLRTSYPRRGSDARASRTAEAVNQLVHGAAEVLADHPINQERAAHGLPLANGIITRGAGAVRHLQSVLQHLDIHTAVVAGDRTVLGLAALFGFTAVKSERFTSLPDTHLEGKVQGALEALENHDFVCLHVKGTDICAHDLDPDAKRRFLERIDQALEPLLDRGLVVAIAADHTTDSLTGRHTGAPVPALLYSPDGRRDTCTAFGESEATRGGLGRITAAGFVTSVLDAMGAVDSYRPADRHFFAAP